MTIFKSESKSLGVSIGLETAALAVGVAICNDWFPVQRFGALSNAETRGVLVAVSMSLGIGGLAVANRFRFIPMTMFLCLVAMYVIVPALFPGRGSQ